MLAIKNNIMAANAARHLGNAYDSLAKSVERLASGLRINSAKDDAAGLAVRELIRADVAVLQQGSRNAQDGISLLQTMEGAMAVIDDSLTRMMELAEQAATGSYSAAQRAIMNSEFAEMADEIDRIAGSTRFNSISMLNSSTGSLSIHVGTTATIDVDKVDITKSGLGINTGVDVHTITFTPELANTTTASILTVGDEAVTLQVTFFDGGTSGTAEDSIGVVLTVGTYTIAQLAAEINEETQALGFDSEGNDKSYDMATVVTNSDDTYSLKLSSRLAADAITIGVISNTTNTTGDFTLADTNATAITDADDTTAATLNADNYATATVTGGVNIASVTAAAAAFVSVTAAINTKDAARAKFGYKMNRLENTISVVDIQAENLLAAESRISDVDVALEMAALTRNQVLSQAGVSMLAQANTMPQMALTLLR
jgi:flagellin